MLKGELEKALDLIMSPREQERGSVVEARRLWLENKDPEAVLKLLPKSCNIERRLMMGVSRVGDKGLHAVFDSIPRSVFPISSSNCYANLVLFVKDTFEFG